MTFTIPFRDSRPVGDLLGGDDRIRLVVPQFQRGYSWGNKQLTRFWKDILEYQEESQNQALASETYFLGPLVLQPGDQIADVKEVIVLDGQQRLATATILLCAMRDYARTIGTVAGNDLARDIQTQFIEKEVSGYSLRLGEDDQDYFRETIQLNEPDTRKKAVIKTEINIRRAHGYFKNRITALTSELEPAEQVQALKKLKTIIRNDMIVACIPVATERDAFKIFETLNDRGLRLSTPDLLLNYLMRKADQSERPIIRRRWTVIVERLGKRDIKKFFRHMWLSRFGDLKKTDLFSALQNDIETRKVKSTEFVESCAEECSSYLQLLNIDNALGDSGRIVKNLIHDLDCESAMPLLLAGYQVLRAPEFAKLVRFLLVFVVRYAVIAELDSGGMEDVFYQLAKDVRARMKDKPRDQVLSRRCISQVKRLLINNSPSEAVLQARIPDLILETEEVATYLLSRLIVNQETKTKEFTFELDESNLEHIFPRNPSPDGWGGLKNQARLAPFLLHLGNLLMLGERLNDNAENAEFPIKKIEYRKSELKMPKQIVKDFPDSDWDEPQMMERAQKLTKEILEVWNFNNASHA